PEWIGSTFLGNSRDFDATQSHGNSPARNIGDRLQKVRSECANPTNLCVHFEVNERQHTCLWRRLRKLQGCDARTIPLQPFQRPPHVWHRLKSCPDCLAAASRNDNGYRAACERSPEQRCTHNAVDHSGCLIWIHGYSGTPSEEETRIRATDST